MKDYLRLFPGLQLGEIHGRCTMNWIFKDDREALRFNEM